MEGIIPVLSASAKDRLHQQLRACEDAGLKLRYLIIANLAEGRRPTDIARMCKVDRSTVYRVARRFCEAGEAGLWIAAKRTDSGNWTKRI